MHPSVCVWTFYIYFVGEGGQAISSFDSSPFLPYYIYLSNAALWKPKVFWLAACNKGRKKKKILHKFEGFWFDRVWKKILAVCVYFAQILPSPRFFVFPFSEIPTFSLAFLYHSYSFAFFSLTLFSYQGKIEKKNEHEVRKNILRV